MMVVLLPLVLQGIHQDPINNTHMDRVGAYMSYINHEHTSKAGKVLQVWDRSGHRLVAVVFQEQQL